MTISIPALNPLATPSAWDDSRPRLDARRHRPIRVASDQSARRRAPIIDWCEENIYVELSDRSGMLSLDSYQREPLAMATSPEVDRISLMWSSQIGKTLMDVALLAYSIAEDPQSILVMHASEQGLDKFMREKLLPILRGNPGLASRVRWTAQGGLRFSGFSFDGGYCTMTTPRSTSGSHGTSATLVIADEVDDYGRAFRPANLTQRTVAFRSSTIWLTSTPTLKGASVIEAEYLMGSQSQYYVPCLTCGAYQRLELERVRDGRIACAECAALWTETERQISVGHGEWRASQPEATARSYHLSQLYSLVAPLPRTMRRIATYGEAEIATQVEAWPYEAVDLPELDASQIRREEPDWTRMVRTVGVDVQADRLEYYVVDFAAALSQKHVVAAGVVRRTPDEIGHWRELRHQLSYYAPDRVSVDGGYEYDLVALGLQTIYPDAYAMDDPPVEIVRGINQESFGRPIRGSRRRGYLFVAVDEAKLQVQTDLATGSLTLAPALPPTVESQLTSERLIRQEGVGGRIKRFWQLPGGRRNEALDCVVYAYAGAIAAWEHMIAAGTSPTLRMEGIS